MRYTGSSYQIVAEKKEQIHAAVKCYVIVSEITV